METTYKLFDGTEHNHSLDTLLAEFWVAINEQLGNGLSVCLDSAEKIIRIKRAILDSPETRFPQHQSEEEVRAMANDAVDLTSHTEHDFWYWEAYLNRIYMASLFCTDRNWWEFDEFIINIRDRKYYKKRDSYKLNEGATEEE
jgi:hypothetical protein